MTCTGSEATEFKIKTTAKEKKDRKTYSVRS